VSHSISAVRFLGPIGHGAVQEGGQNERLGFRDLQAAVRGLFDIVGLVVSRVARRALGRVSREQRRERPELLPRPMRMRMIVTLSALHLQAEEHSRRTAGQQLRLVVGGCEKRAGIGQRIAALRQSSGRLGRRCQQLGGNLVEAEVGSQSQAQPGFQSRSEGPHALVLLSAGQQDVGPGVGEMPGVGPLSEQPFDQPVALVAGRLGQKLPSLARGRDPAGQIEIGPAQEFGIVGRGRREHILRRPVALEIGVDRAGQHGGISRNRVGRSGGRRRVLAGRERGW